MDFFCVNLHAQIILSCLWAVKYSISWKMKSNFGRVPHHQYLGTWVPTRLAAQRRYRRGRWFRGGVAAWLRTETPEETKNFGCCNSQSCCQEGIECRWIALLSLCGAVQLFLADAKKRRVKLFLMVGDFPIGAARQQARQDCSLPFERCMVSCSDARGHTSCCGYQFIDGYNPSSYNSASPHSFSKSCHHLRCSFPRFLFCLYLHTSTFIPHFLLCASSFRTSRRYSGATNAKQKWRGSQAAVESSAEAYHSLLNSFPPFFLVTFFWCAIIYHNPLA